MTTYALLVGINDYDPPVNRLYGCVPDVQAFGTVLEARVPAEQLRLRYLLDRDAHRDAFIAAVREHLGQAGPGDVAVLYYAGHGGEEPVPPNVDGLEGTRKLQTIVLHGSGQRDQQNRLVRPLADKELAVLLSEIGAKAGHFAVFLDCCHSGDADRDPSSRVRAWIADPDRVDPALRDVVVELGQPRRLEDFLGADADGWLTPPLRHVLLSASGPDQKAKEQAGGGTTRGVFSLALQESIGLLGPDATYRTLLATVKSRVERAARDQTPELAVRGAGLGDARVLDGAVAPAATSYRMTTTATGFQIDGGAVDGFVPPDGERAFVLACRKEGAASDAAWDGQVRVVSVEPGTSVVEPIDWTPDDVAYVAVVVGVPFPRADVQLDPPVAGLEDRTAAVHAAVTAAIATSGPTGGPSPDVRVVGSDESNPGALRLRVAVPDAATVAIRRADGSAIPIADVTVEDDEVERAAALVVSRLVHIARWERIRALGDHPTPEGVAVDLELFPSKRADGGRRPDGVEPYPEASVYELAYRRDGDDFVEPYVFARLVNRTDRRLYAAVLDLSERFECYVVEATKAIDPGTSFDLGGGRHLSVTLPDDDLARAGDVAAGDAAREVLLVISSETPFLAEGFTLARMDAPADRGLRVTPEEPPVARWAAFAVTLDITVPS